jgi:hypothetical protein
MAIPEDDLRGLRLASCLAVRSHAQRLAPVSVASNRKEWECAVGVCCAKTELISLRHVFYFVWLRSLCHQFSSTVLGLKSVGICFAELKDQGEDRRGPGRAGAGRVDLQILFREDQLQSLSPLGLCPLLSSLTLSLSVSLSHSCHNLLWLWQRTHWLGAGRGPRPESRSVPCCGAMLRGEVR